MLLGNKVALKIGGARRIGATEAILLTRESLSVLVVDVVEQGGIQRQLFCVIVPTYNHRLLISCPAPQPAVRYLTLAQGVLP